MVSFKKSFAMAGTYGKGFLIIIFTASGAKNIVFLSCRIHSQESCGYSKAGVS
jgi:hypothetical protein